MSEEAVMALQYQKLDRLVDYQKVLLHTIGDVSNGKFDRKQLIQYTYTLIALQKEKSRAYLAFKLKTSNYDKVI